MDRTRFVGERDNSLLGKTHYIAIRELSLNRWQFLFIYAILIEPLYTHWWHKLLGFILTIIPTIAVSATTPLPMPAPVAPIIIEQRVEVPKVEVNSTSSVRNYVEQEAITAGVDPKIAISIVKCESGFVPQQSKHLTKEGIREDSWGIWQIHLPSNPEVTREQAMDVEWSTAWSLKMIKAGEAHLWSCYK